MNCEKKYQLKDAELADHCLNLYYKGHAEAPEEIRQFLAPLVLLLMGKEPSLDRASLLSNFILLNCVKMGLFSFTEALKTMPMIPIGAVSSKQFLLHLIDRPIDSMTYVQSKKAKENGSSFFLSHTVDVLGRADKWLQKYDNVTTAAVRCCVHILSRMKPVPIDNSDLNQLKIILEQLYRNIKIPHEELGEALDQEAGLRDNKDLVGEWAINYVFKLHPLSKILV